MTLEFRSTRSDALLGGFTDVLLEGLAPDGGLAMPQRIPSVSLGQLVRWSNLPYPNLAAEVIGCFATDIAPDTLLDLTRAAYTRDRFGDSRIAPLSHLAEEGGAPIGLLELSNGPTLAFKDMAMQFLGHAFEYVLHARGQTLSVLGATSGDTGSAAEYAMRGKKAVRVFMLSPEGRMSPFQRAQMYSLQDSNIFNITVPGSFDVCQDMVKAVSSDLGFKAAQRIGAVNSINWGRITAQTVYYFSGYFQAVERYGLSIGDRVSFSVPSGNFGNVLSGYVAQRMGLPIDQLVVATNENNVLDEFFTTGRYRPRSIQETQVTSSPSMDISKASNFERFVFEMLEGDAQRLARLWAQLAEQGEFQIAPSDPAWALVRASGLVSGTSTHAMRLETIGNTYRRYGRIIDPHTADGLNVARRFLKPGQPMICLETALPVKFSETIEEVLGRPAPRPSGLDGLEDLPQRVFPMAADVERLKSFIVEHSQ
ncbi:ThrC Threonine synthase [Burkholderiales bacterium]